MTHVEIGIAHLALPGEDQSGDSCVVKSSASRTLIGVIDGVGHGAEAARAAAVASEVLEAFAGEPVGSLLQHCHERLRTTRGAAITLITLDVATGVLEWVGAGNVAAALLHNEPSGKCSRRELLIRGGMAGSSLPSTETLQLEVCNGDTIVLATDGLDRCFMDGIGADAPPQQLAEQLLAQYGSALDDALVVVARVQGECR
jgi:negative regulator of sigma-B (phosphoserine phosphatase)